MVMMMIQWMTLWQHWMMNQLMVFLLKWNNLLDCHWANMINMKIRIKKINYGNLKKEIKMMIGRKGKVGM